MKTTKTVLFLFALATVIFVYGTVPFLMLPTVGQAIWAAGFSESMANNSWIFDFYARDFGIPNPAAIAFGLSKLFVLLAKFDFLLVSMLIFRLVVLFTEILLFSVSFFYKKNFSK